MRDLLEFEIQSVTGAGNSPCAPTKGNNGFGNGGDDPAPGNSAGKGKDGAGKTADRVR